MKPLVGTIADLHADGVTRVHIWCYNPACHHSGDLSTAAFAPTLPLQQLRLRLRCGRCGGREIGLQADWSQYQEKLRAGKLLLGRSAAWAAASPPCDPQKAAAARGGYAMSSQPIEFPPYPANQSLGQQIVFLTEVGALREVLRQTLVCQPPRQENDAEHSWHVALMAMVLAEHAVEKIDVLRAVKMLLIHDIVEIDAGDTFIYDETAKADQAEREQAAADRIFALLPVTQAADLRATWEEFEAAQSAEARFAKAIDRLQPLLLNFAAGGGGWRRHNIPANRVREINSVIELGAPALWAYAQQVINEAVERGYLAPPATESAD